MNIRSNMKVLAIVALLSACCHYAVARRLHRPSGHYPARVVVVRAPLRHHVITSRVSNRFSQKERLAMALAYLNSHPRLTVKQYVKMTSLSKAAAEAELDSFALDRDIPIHAVVEGKKKFYM